MMIRLTFLVYIISIANLNGQTLGGTVKSKHGTVVPNIWVTIIGGDKDQTDETGQFQLNLANCINCKPGKPITFIVFNDEYGFHKITEPISQDYTTLIEIEKKPNTVGITGVVKDSKSNEFLEGINVKLLSTPQADKVPVVRTDKYGTFVIYLKKDALGPTKYVELIFSDDNGLFQDKKETKNILAPFDVLLNKEGRAHTIKISRYIKTGVKISPGDLVSIKSTGSIKVGAWVGHSEPNGRTGGVGNADLSNYNIVKELNHAALLYRITGDYEWKYAGKEIEFYAQKDGYLEFEVNDNEKSNNSGSYQVKVTIK